LCNIAAGGFSGGGKHQMREREREREKSSVEKKENKLVAFGN